MAPKKKQVTDTPICDPAYVRRIDPEWMPGRVPRWFWEDRAHRRDYLLWVAGRLAFRTMEDFYRLQFGPPFWSKNRGAGLNVYWDGSALAAVRDCFPLHDWKPWLFPVVAHGFWGSLANQRSYLDWLGQRLGYRSLDDWYQVTVDDFEQNKGNGLQVTRDRSPVRRKPGASSPTPCSLGTAAGDAASPWPNYWPSGVERGTSDVSLP